VPAAYVNRVVRIGGAAVGAVNSQLGNGFGRKTAIDQTVWPPAPITPEALAALPLHVLVVGTNGSTAAVETARSQLEKAVPSRFPPDPLSFMSPDSNRLLAGYKQLANVVILVSRPIAGCSLAVAVAAGLTERKRPFSVLRLTDVSVAMLRRVVALETVVPLVPHRDSFDRRRLPGRTAVPARPTRPNPCRAWSPVPPDRRPGARRAGDSRLDVADVVADHRSGRGPLRLRRGVRRKLRRVERMRSTLAARMIVMAKVTRTERAEPCSRCGDPVEVDVITTDALEGIETEEARAFHKDDRTRADELCQRGRQPALI
jgi:hypothetical protein